MDDAEEPGEVDAVVHEESRLRGPRRLLRWGLPSALVVTFASSATGLDGSVGVFLLLLLVAGVLASAGLWIGVLLLVDDFRGAPTSRRRGRWTIALFVGALLCMVAVGGVAGTLGGTS